MRREKLEDYSELICEHKYCKHVYIMFLKLLTQCSKKFQTVYIHGTL